MKKIKRTTGFTLVELLVVVAIIALLIAILLPSLQTAREMSKRTNCQANVRSIGTACYIYADENLDIFPTAPHMIHNNPDPEVSYIGNMGGGGAGSGVVRNEPSIHGKTGTGTEQLSTTRSFWMLVRSGNIIPKNFLCPSSEDSSDPTVDTTTYYDFIGFGTCSYGYQIPYDTANPCKPNADRDPRMVLVADRGPWSAPDPAEKTDSGGSEEETGFFVDKLSANASGLFGLMIRETNPSEAGYMYDASPPEQWKRFNSPNHGGLTHGAGQSALYPDGHATFQNKPTVGVDTDNIYTQMGGSSYSLFSEQMQWGNLLTDDGKTYPGIDSLGSGVTSFTDTLIWP